MRGVGSLVVAAAALLALAGCAESGSGEAIEQPTTSPSGPSSASGDPSPSGDDGCPYLSAEQVTEALGSPTHETAGTLNACFFDPDGGTGPSVMLSRVDMQIEPSAYAQQSKALCHGEVTDVEAGDEAFACVAALGPQGQLYSGRVLITVAVNGVADEEAGIAVAARLLPEVTIPPGA